MSGFSDRLIRLEQVDSTNDRLMELARQGAAEGTALLARTQTAGRGTGERSFFSPEGEGVYLSVLLRPQAPVEELLTLTGWAAVAVQTAIQMACGASCAIKWLNDLYLNGKKVCGILAELSPALDYVVLGVGINVAQTAERFAEQGLGESATSLRAEGYCVETETLAAAVLAELERMSREFPREKARYLAWYRAHCMTLGRRVTWTENGSSAEGRAVEIDERFALVALREERCCTISSGRVKFREEQAE